MARLCAVGTISSAPPATTCTGAVAAVHYPFLPVRALLWDRFPLLDTITSATAPVHVVAGGADEIVPTAQSRAVAEAARAPYVEVPDARHNDPALSHGPVVIEAVRRLAG